ncbi:PaaI family thioesterase [Pulveribacter suum]|uniref:Phenylacetic acid degradation protein n=1 Tax=Pulveribacter suum TaxID=2116657 RepID=A0A2P1NK47_9BURK|nr:PaaI family thioesterase [Pulveribacter suum]AVP57411.1 phenylacetic acid degradation protein [Pulveribacter suum]
MTDLHQRIASSFKAQGLMATLGARLALVQDGEVRIELPFSAALSQQHGYVHAGAITSVVDSACGYAALTRGPAGCEVVTAEFKTNFVRPAIGERFIAVGRVVNAGRQLAVVTGEVLAHTADGAEPKLVALMQATMVYVQPR